MVVYGKILHGRDKKNQEYFIDIVTNTKVIAIQSRDCIFLVKDKITRNDIRKSFGKIRKEKLKNTNEDVNLAIKRILYLANSLYVKQVKYIGGKKLP